MADYIISGSAVSTGSFGRIEVLGTEFTASPITALNNKSQNRLVTIGSTTTELDGEASFWEQATIQHRTRGGGEKSNSWRPGFGRVSVVEVSLEHSDEYDDPESSLNAS